MRQIKAYKDTLIAISDPNTASYVTNQCGRLGLQGKWDEAIRILTGYYEHCTDTNPDKARVEYLLAELYLGKRDIQQAKALPYPGFHYRHSECQESIYVFAAIGNPAFSGRRHCKSL